MQQNNFVAQQPIARQQLAINQAMQQMMLNNLGQQGMDGQNHLMANQGMNQQYQNFNQGFLSAQQVQGWRQPGVKQNPPPGVDGSSNAADNGAKEKKVTDASKDKHLSNDGNKQGLAGNNNSSGAFGDNTIPMGMAFQSFGGGMGQSPPSMSQMNMLGQQGFPMGSNVGYDGGLNSMGMDVNSMNMGGGMVDMNSMNMGGSMVDMNSMNMGAMNNMGLGSFGGFGMNSSVGKARGRTERAASQILPTGKWPNARTTRRSESAPVSAATKAKPAATPPPADAVRKHVWRQRLPADGKPDAAANAVPDATATTNV